VRGDIRPDDQIITNRISTPIEGLLVMTPEEAADFQKSRPKPTSSQKGKKGLLNQIKRTKRHDR